MALEPEKKNRSYQFGRLLAVLEKAERDALIRRKKGTQRNEDADAVCQAPHVCGKIDNRTAQNAYYPRLKPGARNYYDKLIGEIMLVISGCPEGENG